MYIMDIKPLGNGRFQINGEDVHAPSLSVAENRYADKHPEHHNDLMMRRKLKNDKVKENHLTAATAAQQRTPSIPRNNSYNQAAHA